MYLWLGGVGLLVLVVAAVTIGVLAYQCSRPGYESTETFGYTGPFKEFSIETSWGDVNVLTNYQTVNNSIEVRRTIAATKQSDAELDIGRPTLSDGTLTADGSDLGWTLVNCKRISYEVLFPGSFDGGLVSMYLVSKSGDVSIQGSPNITFGKVVASATSGDVSAEHVRSSATFSASVTSGTVGLKYVEGLNLNLTATSGSIKGKDVSQKISTGTLHAQTRSGNVALSRVIYGNPTIVTQTGSIAVELLATYFDGTYQIVTDGTATVLGPHTGTEKNGQIGGGGIGQKASFESSTGSVALTII